MFFICLPNRFCFFSIPTMLPLLPTLFSYVSIPFVVFLSLLLRSFHDSLPLFLFPNHWCSCRLPVTPLPVPDKCLFFTILLRKINLRQIYRLYNNSKFILATPFIGILISNRRRKIMPILYLISPAI